MQIPCLAFLSLLVSDGPQPEQIFTVVKISETKIAIKSGYGEYMHFSNRNGIAIDSPVHVHYCCEVNG